jgi:hypothetical protein
VTPALADELQQIPGVESRYARDQREIELAADDGAYGENRARSLGERAEPPPHRFAETVGDTGTLRRQPPRIREQSLGRVEAYDFFEIEGVPVGGSMERSHELAGGCGARRSGDEFADLALAESPER